MDTSRTLGFLSWDPLKYPIPCLIEIECNGTCQGLSWWMLHWWKVSDSNTDQPLLFTINVEHEAGKKYRFSSLRHYPTGNRTQIAKFSWAYSTHLGRKLDRWGFCLEYLEDFFGRDESTAKNRLPQCQPTFGSSKRHICPFMRSFPGCILPNV